MQLKLSKGLRKDLKKFKIDNQKELWQPLLILTLIHKNKGYFSQHMREVLKMLNERNFELSRIGRK